MYIIVLKQHFPGNSNYVTYFTVNNRRYKTTLNESDIYLDFSVLTNYELTTSAPMCQVLRFASRYYGANI